MHEPEIDYSRKWYVMSAVAMGIFLATIDGSIVNVALPTLIRELNTNFATVEWVVLGYLLTLATLLLGIGRLGDMIGKKPIYVTGFVVFTAGSVLCGLAPTVEWLIAFRVIQALGGAMVFALGVAIVTEAFPPSERGKALGISGTVVSVGIVLGPTLGGVIIDAISWHWIFLVNLPVGIVGTLLAARFVPNTKPTSRQKFDFPGAIALFISLLALLLALTWGQEAGFTSPEILGLFGLWALFLAIFVIIEWRSTHPMIELSLFEDSLFSMSLVTGFMTFVAIAGTIILLPFYLENVLGYNTREVGLLLAVVPVMLGIVSPVSGVLSDKFGTRSITVIGLVVLLLGYLAITTLSAETTTWGYILRLAPVGIGMGVFQSPNNSAIMGSVARQRLGVASGMLSLTRTLGQTTGIAVLSAFWASRVMAHTGQILPEGATTAPISAQVAGLQQTYEVVAVMITLALALSVWGLVQERRLKTAPAPAQPAPKFSPPE
ncbi:MAG: Riboflavin transporter RibZ [Anaerolineae bacterium]|nr:Riboflavin transporter RibZ [Anaerolineae bacterium]